MTIPTGKEVFDDYLSTFDFEDGDKPDLSATDGELYEHFDNYLQGTLAAKYPAPILEKITVAAGDAYDIAQVKALL